MTRYDPDAFISGLNPDTPSRSDPVADGADEIKDIKSKVKASFPYANSPLGVSNFAIETAINETIPSILERLTQLDGQGPIKPPEKPEDESFSGIVASCKYNALEPDEPNAPEGSPLPYEHNIQSVQIPHNENDGGTGFASCRVTFKKPVPAFDRHYTALIQPFATSNQHVIATITNQQDNFVEWTWLVYDQQKQLWTAPQQKLGFAFVAVDYEV
jgi:hypothetical protein